MNFSIYLQYPVIFTWHNFFKHTYVQYIYIYIYNAFAYLRVVYTAFPLSRYACTRAPRRVPDSIRRQVDPAFMSGPHSAKQPEISLCPRVPVSSSASPLGKQQASSSTSRASDVPVRSAKYFTRHGRRAVKILFHNRSKGAPSIFCNADDAVID